MRGNATRKTKRAKYRSDLERKIAKSLHQRGVNHEYETERIPYTVPAVVKHYTPDFIITTKSRKKIYVEAKGIWDAADRKKHLLLQAQRPELDIRFVFSNSNNRISKLSRVTYGDICMGRGRGQYSGVCWKYSDKRIPKEWLEE